MMQDRPTAIVCLSDGPACQLIEALTQIQIRVPEDIAVVGFNDYADECVPVPVPLTTVRVPLRQEGRMAAAIMLDLMEKRAAAPARITVPCELVVRESCGVRAGARGQAAGG